MLLPALLAAFPLVSPAAPMQERDAGKRLVEQPLERALPLLGPLPASRGSIAPGLVAWHADFDAACAAARASGKPVLLFQLLGRLDEEFC